MIICGQSILDELHRFVSCLDLSEISPKAYFYLLLLWSSGPLIIPLRSFPFDYSKILSGLEFFWVINGDCLIDSEKEGEYFWCFCWNFFSLLLWGYRFFCSHFSHCFWRFGLISMFLLSKIWSFQVLFSRGAGHGQARIFFIRSFLDIAHSTISDSWVFLPGGLCILFPLSFQWKFGKISVFEHFFQLKIFTLNGWERNGERTCGFLELKGLRLEHISHYFFHHSNENWVKSFCIPAVFQKLWHNFTAVPI